MHTIQMEIKRGIFLFTSVYSEHGLFWTDYVNGLFTNIVLLSILKNFWTCTHLSDKKMTLPLSVVFYTCVISSLEFSLCWSLCLINPIQNSLHYEYFIGTEVSLDVRAVFGKTSFSEFESNRSRWSGFGKYNIYILQKLIQVIKKSQVVVKEYFCAHNFFFYSNRNIYLGQMYLLIFDV